MTTTGIKGRFTQAMIEIAVPGLRTYQIKYLVLDVNGTLALDGEVLPGVFERLSALKERIEPHLITADTHGRQAGIDAALGVCSVRIGPGRESDQKGQYVRTLGAAFAVAVGNGANDVDMLRSAAIGIAVLGSEGLASRAHQTADVLVHNIEDALDLLLHPSRLVATLRR